MKAKKIQGPSVILFLQKFISIPGYAPEAVNLTVTLKINPNLIQGTGNGEQGISMKNPGITGKLVFL
jgi:hypothetical protein